MVMYGEFKLVRTWGDNLNGFKIAAPWRTLTNEAIVQHNSYVSFRCCGVAVAFFPIPNMPHHPMKRTCLIDKDFTCPIDKDWNCPIDKDWIVIFVSISARWFQNEWIYFTFVPENLWF